MRYITPICLFFALFLAFLTGKAAAPPLLDWQKCMGGSGQDMPVKLIRSSDGFIYTLGSSDSNDGDVGLNRGSLDVWITKQDSLGNLLWQKSYGGSDLDIGTGILELPGGNFLLAGYTSSHDGDVHSNHGNFDAWIIKINSSGNILWEKTIGGSLVDLCYSVIQLQDGGFLLGGGTYSNDGDVSGHHGDQDFWLIKTNSSGVIQWQKSLGGSGLDVCYSLTENNSAEIVACGSTNSSDGDVTGRRGAFDFWVVKLNSTGNVLWKKCFGGSLQESAQSVCKFGNAQYAVAGYSKSVDGDLTSNYGYTDYWVIILDESGNLIRQKNYGGSGSDIAYSVIPTIDGGLLITGGSTSNDSDVTGNKGAEDVFLLKSDAQLNKEWSKTYGGNGNDRPSCALQYTDGGFCIAAYTYSNNGDVTGNHGTSDFWILKLACKTPVAAFSPSSDTLCAAGQISILNNSSNASSFEWSLNYRKSSDDVNPSMNISHYGYNRIILSAQTCYASDTTQVFVYLSHKPDANISSDKAYLCSGETIQLMTNSSGRLIWSTGDTNSVITVNHGGSYTLTVSNGVCFANATYNLTEKQSPTVNLGNDTSICAGSSLVLNAPASMNSYLWQDGSIMQQFLVTDSGSYHVLVNDQYCSASGTITVSLRNCGMPIANFSTSSQVICENASIQFTDLTGDATSWSWSFPGGQPSTSTLQNPVIHYPLAGTYSVILIAGNAIGSNTLMRVNYVRVNPNPAKPVITVNGNNLQSSPATSYQWQFNQVPVSGAGQQTFIANLEGDYRVMIWDNNQCSAISDPVTILLSALPDLQATGAGLKVYPNPTYGDVNLEDRNQREDADIRIFDSAANLVFGRSITKEETSGSIRLDFSTMPAGTYFLEYRTQSGKVTGSVLIKQ